MRHPAIARTLLLLVATSLVSGADTAPLDAIFAPLAGAASPGLAVLVRRNGRTVFQRGYGVRELKSQAKIDQAKIDAVKIDPIKIDAATGFRLASFTKQFTAMAVMLLVHDGKLRYDQTLTDLFPDFPAYGKAITVRHLLTHTAGLPDYEDLMDEMEKGKPPIWTATRQIQDEEVLALLKQQSRPKFAAGSNWSYSNSGYVVLGLIVARVSGQPFEEVLHARIFQPLGMNGTLAFVNGRNTIPHRAFGHTREAGAFIETDQSPTSATLGDGGVYSNLDDLAKWDAALAGHALLDEREMHAAVTPVKLADGSGTNWPAAPGGDNLNPGKPVAYGFGWFLDRYNGRPRMWHSGSTQGFRTVIERFPQEKLTIVVLCNRTDLDAASLALRAADALLKKTP